MSQTSETDLLEPTYRSAVRQLRYPSARSVDSVESAAHHDFVDYRSVLERIVTWAAKEPNVRTVVLTGSAASGTHHELSDRDIELHVLRTAPLEEDDSWCNSLGEVLAVERLENGVEQPTRLVYYVGGKIDFTLVSIGSNSDQVRSN